MSQIVTVLALTCESKARQVLNALAEKLRPIDGVYQNTLKIVATNDLIPWLGTIHFLRFFCLVTLTQLAQTFTFPLST
jgi:hypothetical protein